MKGRYSSGSSSGELLVSIFSVAAPVMLTEFVQAFYNIADSAYVSRFEATGMTAISIASPLHKVIYALSLLCGIGASIVLSQSLGEGEQTSVRKIIRSGYGISLLCWALMLAASLFLAEPYFRMFSSNQKVICSGVAYIRVLMIGSIFPLAENVSVRCLQALGIARKPMLFQIGAAFVNILLDPLLIWGGPGIPALGVMGAAIATVLSQAGSSLLSFLTIRNVTRRFLAEEEHRFSGLSVRIGRAGFPAFLEIALVSAYISGLNAIMASFSEAALTSLGIYYKLQTILLIPTDGVMLGAIPLMSYSFGGRQYERVWQVFRLSWLISLGANLLGTAGCLLFTDPLLFLFHASGELLEIGRTALRIICLAFPFFGFTILPASFFQSTEHGRYSVILTVLREVVFLVPIAWFLSRWGLTATWFTFVISEVLAAVFAMSLAMHIYRGWGKAKGNES